MSSQCKVNVKECYCVYTVGHIALRETWQLEMFLESDLPSLGTATLQNRFSLGRKLCFHVGPYHLEKLCETTCFQGRQKKS